MVASLLDYILVTEPLLSKDILERILAVIDGVEWRTPKDKHGYNRTCKTFPISMAVDGKYPLAKDRLNDAKWADETLVLATHQALAFYKKQISDVYVRSDIGFDILRYEVGQKISYHVDDSEPRVLTMSIALNDNYSGGEFRFWHEDSATYRLPLGSAILFPPNFMYGHEILPVTSGTRYSMITWFS